MPPVDPEEQSNIPNNPVSIPSGGEPSPDGSLSDGSAGARLGHWISSHSRRTGGAWQPPSPEELRRDFPQHEIHGILGRGGIGAVYKGWQNSLDRFVAIKILPPGLDDDSGVDVAERFKREAKAMAQLRHNGIVAVYDSGQTADGLLYFVMEYVDGSDVHQLVKERGRLEPAEALRIAGAVCDALAYAHSQGIVHRDIKPSNIVLDASGTVKITDFGLAKSDAPQSSFLTSRGVSIGTPDFMAPESFQGAGHVDHRADIYAVGVMLYQMLTGRLPRGRFAPPSSVVRGLDKRLDSIVDKALQTEPGMRYSSASEMQAEIARVTPKSPQSAAADQNATAPRARPRSKPLIVAGALAVIAIVAVVWAPWKKSAPPISRAESNLIPPTPNETGISTAGKAVAAATKNRPFVNSLGMKFVPVPGTKVLFSIWDTRVSDYAAYARGNKLDEAWTNQQKAGVPVGREPEHPVLAVTAEEAEEFCRWLTEKETTEGKLPEGARYRLPADEEWSRAAGLPAESGATPAEKSGKNAVDYPWGIGFPPPGENVGNYADSAWHGQFPKEPWIEGYSDGYATTSPVGAFPANAFGLFDLGGNVCQWCEDWYDASEKERVLRGSSWNGGSRAYLLSSHRTHDLPSSRHSYYGFRCVLEPPPSAAK